MDEDTISTNTSAEDRTEDFCDNPTQDLIAEGLLGLIKPTVDLLDEKFKATRTSQLELRLQIEALVTELDKISAEQQSSIPLETYTKKLVDAQQKISIVGNILQTTQEYNIEDILKSDVYEPSEDTFLLLDALEADLDNIQHLKPSIFLEVGPGSGVVITAIAKLLGGRAQCFAVDISPNACAVTQRTAASNDVKVEVINSDLLTSLRQDKLIDVLVFNPPYVLTSSEELKEEEMISKAYAGGARGRQVMDRLFPVLYKALSAHCIFYLLVLKENDPEEIKQVLSQHGFSGETLISRQVPGERLSVLKFTKSAVV